MKREHKISTFNNTYIKAMMYSNKQSKEKKYPTTRTLGHTYTVLRIGLGLPQQTHINPKERNKERRASLVVSWAGPLVPGERNLKSPRQLEESVAA